MKIITQIFRYIVALTFIFSGFVKLVDPVGTKIKLLEYFSEEVLNITFLNDYAIYVGFILIAVEFGLGIWLLFGLKAKKTSELLLLTISVFLFLTWYSAYFNKVTDCGCFGDAVKLTPWQTFYKNVFLFIMIVWLLKYHRFIKPFLKQSQAKLGAYFLFSLGLISMIYSYIYLPIIDFRPYAIGKNITEGMTVPLNAPRAEFKDIWYYKVDGKTKKFRNEDEPWNIKGATFVDRKTITLKEGYTPPIHDFSIENEAGDITDKVLQADEIYLIISSNPTEMKPQAIAHANATAKKLKQENKKVIGLFSTIDAEIEKRFDFPLYLTDETSLKTMIRSNPGMILLHKGTVVDKKPWRKFE